MKKILLFSTILFSTFTNVFSQGNTCAQATPFCEAPGGAGVTFPNSTGVTAPTGPSYGCLGTQPNPAYFFIKTSSAGSMVYNISQVNSGGTGIDVDFVAWGPFTDYYTMCNNLTGSCSPGGTSLPQTCTGNIEDCSYSIAATEVMTLNSPGAGYFYLIMITNYAGVTGNITFNQTSGPASDCSITCPSALSGDGFLLTDGVTPVPSTIACGTGTFGIMASSNSPFGSPIVPAVMVSFLNNTNASNQIDWYEDGNYLGCFGPACGTFTLTPSTNTDLQFSYSSPSAVTTFTLCENNTAQPNMNYTVTNLATHNVIATGTWNDDGACQTITIPAGQITGVATFTASCGACITSTDYGYASFNPALAGPGTHTVTYTFNPGGTCAPYTFTKTITIAEPSVSAVASPTTICQGSSSTLTASGSPSSTNVTFSNGTDFNIPDNNATGITSGISVTGLPGTVGTSLVNVNINITHPFDGDLDISLQCPNGTIIDLSSDNGGSGDNYTNTTFQTGGTAVTSGTAPFTGTFAPEQAFSGLSGCNLNGTWNLIVKDDGATDIGTLTGWSITFTNQNTYTWAPSSSVSPTSGATVTATPTVTTTYTVTATDATGCTKTNTVTVNVNPLPTVNAVSSQTVCAGGTVAASNFTSSPAGATFAWTNNNTAIGLGANGTGSIGSFTAANVATQQTATITVTPTLSGCAGTPITFTITVNPRPTITAMSNITNGCVGSTVSVPNFTVTPASTISWTNNNTATGLAASGTGNIGSFTATGAGTSVITVNATTTVGSCSTTTSTTFSITVNALPVISAMSNISACGGSTVTVPAFTVTPSSTVNWTNNNTATGLSAGSGSGNIASFTAASVASATTSTITLNTTSAAGCAATPVTFNITVNPTPVISAMSNVSVCSGSTVSAINFTVTPAATANWTNNNTAVGIAASGSGNIASYTAPVVASSTTGTVTVNATLGSCAAAPRTFNVTINPTPVISTMANVAACGGSTVTVPAFTVTPAATVNWTNNNTGTGLSSASGSGNIPSFTAANVGTTTTGTITANASLSGCSATAQTFNIVISPTPTITAVSNVTACGGSSVSAINFVVNPGGTVNWTNNNTAVGIAGSGTGNISSYTAPTVASATTATLTANASLGSCNASPITFNVTINPTPVITAMANVTACGGSTVSVPAFTVTPASTVNWTNNNTGTGLSTGSGSGNIPSFTAASVGAATTSTITLNSTLTGCSASPVTFSITVNPTPVITAMSNITACGGAAVSAINYTVTPAATANWTNNNTAVGIAGSGSGNIAGYTAPVVASSTTGTITVNSTLGSCAATPRTFNVTINPTPVISAMSNVSACGGSTVTIPNFTVTPVSTVNWTNNNTGTGLSSASGSGNIPSFTAANVGTTTTGTVTANATLSGCSATAQTFNIVISPTPTITAVSNVTACGGASVSAINFVVNPGGTVNWTNNNTAVGIGGSGTGNIAGYTAPTVGSVTTGTISTSASLGSCNSSPVTFNVTINPTPVISAMSNITACGGSAVSVPAFTVTPAATATWSNNNTATGLSSSSGTGNISGFTAANVTTATSGTITVNSTLTGCAASPQSFTITVNPTPSIAALSNQTVCSGGTVSAVTFNSTPSSGVTYGWTNTNTNIGLAASGTSNPIVGYTAPSVVTQQQGVISVTPTLGSCIGTPRNFTVTINPNPTITSTGTVTPSNCGSSTGSILGVTATGAPALSYSWNGGASQATPDISSIPAGSYNLVVTDGNGCTVSSAFSVNNPGAPAAPLVTTSAAICVGASTTLSIVSPVGGTTYNWSGPAGSLGTGTSINITNATLADAGNYSASATAAGCTGAQSAASTLVVNPLPVPQVTPSSSSFCSDASIVISGATSNPGGTATIPPNGYQWTLNGNPIPGATSSTYTTTVAGNYGLTITNSNGCVASAATTATISNYSEPVLGTPGTLVNSNCVTPSGSIANIGISGGSPTYTYTWYNGSSSVISSSTATADLTGQPAGNYSLIVVDNNGCNDTLTATIQNDNAPSAPLVASNNANCSGFPMNPVSVTGSGGTITWYADAGLSTSLSTSNPYTPTNTATDTLYVTETSNGCESSSTEVIVVVNQTPNAPAVTNPTYCQGDVIQDLVATGGGGTITWYSDSGLTTQVGTGSPFASGITATTTLYVNETSLGCVGDSVAVTVTVNSLPTIDITTMVLDSASCGGVSDGGISGVVVGGNPGFTYEWSNAGGVVSTSTTTPDLVNQTVGSYTLQVTDVNGCISQQGPINITNSNTPPTPVFVTSSDTVYCAGDAVTVLSASASTGIVYWYSDAGLTTQIGIGDTLNPTGITTSTTVYVVANNNSCLSLPLPVSITFNPLPNVSANSPTTCAGGQVTLSGTGAATYTWDNGVTDGVAFTPASSGLYVVTGVDTNGCVNTDTISVTVNQPPASPSVSNAAYCQGDVIQDLVATGTGGTINWYSDAGLVNLVGTGSPYASGVTSTTTLFATETVLGCESSATPVTVTVNSLPVITVTSIVVDSSSCGGVSDGSITGVGIGGTPFFTYVWSNASGVVSTSTTTPDLTNQTAGSYTLQVTDGNGCVSQQGPIDIVSIAIPPTPVFVTSSDTVYCDGEAVSALTANAGTGTVYWYADAALTTQIGIGNTLTPTGITSSTTIYVAANNSNCLSSPLPVSITFNALPNVSGNSPSTCPGGQVTLSGSGAVTYTWDNGVTDGVPFTPAGAGSYIVTGTDANGCVNTDTVSVSIYSLPNVGATQGTSAAVCSGSSLTLNGTGAVSYVWDNGVTDGVAFTPTASGVYNVTGTDANGCVNTFAVTVTINSLPVVDAGAVNDTLPCGSVLYTLSGATTNATNPQYTWSGPGIVANGNTATPDISGPGVYTFVVVDGVTGCTASDNITVVSNAVTAGFTQDVTSGFTPLSVNFTNQSVGASSYAWSFGDNGTSTNTNPSNVYNAVGTYNVMLVAYNGGCSDTAYSTIVVNANSSIIIPNIFSPNGDGINDVLTIYSTGIETLNIDIFNRWGQKVYLITAPGQNWDGKLSNGDNASEGTYFYLLKAVGFDKKEYEAQGPVMLVK